MVQESVSNYADPPTWSTFEAVDKFSSKQIISLEKTGTLSYRFNLCFEDCLISEVFLQVQTPMEVLNISR